MQLDHTLLRTFIACVDAMSFNRAAQHVHRSPATVSTHISRLEQEVGEALFLRDTRNLALTRAGEKLDGYARRILRLHDQAAESFGRPAIRGTITIGAPDDYISQFLPPVFRRFGLLYPQAEIRVFCAQSTALVPLIAAGEIDLAVVTRSKGVGGRLIRREPMVWIAARDGAALEKDPLPVALFEPGSEARRVTLAALAQSNLPYRAAYESFSLAGLLTIVEAGLAVAAVSKMSAPPELILPPGAVGLKAPESLDIALIRNPTANQQLSDAVEELVMQVP